MKQKQQKVKRERMSVCRCMLSTHYVVAAVGAAIDTAAVVAAEMEILSNYKQL